MFNRPNHHPRPYNYYPNYPNHPQNQNHQWQQSVIPKPNLTPYQIYAKPKQPANWHTNSQPQQSYYYPIANQSPPSSILNYFHNKKGEVDFDKMLSTVGQVANTVKQISPMVKQFGSIMKNFK